MRIDGITLTEGSELQNATLASGTEFPDNPNAGELFYRSDAAQVYFYNGTDWAVMGSGGEESGPAASALKLETARNINGVAFDGTQDISFTSTDVAEGTNLYFTDERAADAAPVQSVFGREGDVALQAGDVTGALGFTPANKAGDTFTGTIVAPTFTGSLDGNAATATSAGRLTTARTIGGVAFDGSANIALTTTGVTEGTNLYHTTARAAAAAPVQSVFGRTGAVALTGGDVTTALGYTPVQQSALDLKANLASPTFTGTVGGITKAMVGLGNVDNTTDAAKPISTATQTALNLKSDITYVDSRVAALVNSSPATLDTLDELAAALGDDPNFATTTATSLGNRVRFDASQTLTAGQQTTAKTNIGLANVDNTSDANKPVSTATQTALNLKANLASPTFTGTVTAPGIVSTAITVRQVAPGIIFDESDQTGAAGMWKLVADAGTIRVDKNTAAARDFTTYFSPFTITSGGVLTVPTPAVSDNGTAVASTAYVVSRVAQDAVLSGKSFVTDLDALTDNRFFGFGEAATGAPVFTPGNVYDAVGLQMHQNGQRTQLVVGGDADGMYIRTDDNPNPGGTFGAWRKIWADNNVKSGDIETALAGFLRISRTSYPQVALVDTDAGANLGRWGMWVNEGGDSLVLGPQTDAGAGTMNLQIIRSGGAKIYGNIFDIDNGTNTAATRISMTGPAGYDRSLSFYTAGKNRWSLTAAGGAETGSNAGTNFALHRFNDAGTYIDSPIIAQRDTGNISLQNDLTVYGGQIYITQGAGADRSVAFRTGTNNRWVIGADGGAETGTGNAGSNFYLNRYSDAGTFIDAPIYINRADGAMSINSPTYFNKGVIFLNSSAGTARTVAFLTNGKERWYAGANGSAESGSNAGTDYIINRHADDGSFIDQPFNIIRSTGNVNIANDLIVSGGQIYLSQSAGNDCAIALRTGSNLRWYFGSDSTAESGSNAGSNWFINRHSDAGGYIDTPMSISRATGAVTFNKPVSVGGDISATGDVKGSTLRFVGDRLENHSQDIDTAVVGVNYWGYNGGTTRFRNFMVFDGKGGGILTITGSTKAASFAGPVAASSVTTTGNVTVGNTVVVRGSTGTEGGQVTLGFGNNTTTSLTGEDNNTWNVDVQGANNALRFFRKDATGAYMTALSMPAADGWATFAHNVTARTFVTTYQDGIRLKNNTSSANYGVIMRNDSSNFHLLMTNSGDADGNFNALRPFYVNLATGNVGIDHSLYVRETITAGGFTTAGATNVPSINITQAAPVVNFFENDQTGATGVWRIVADSGIIRFDRNTAATRNFATYDTPVSMRSVGGVVFKGEGTFEYDLGLVSGAVSLRHTDSSSHRLTVNGATTVSLIWDHLSGTRSMMMIEVVNGGAYAFSIPGVTWVNPDGTLTTTYADYTTALGRGLKASGTDWIIVWSRGNGTTTYGRIV